MRPYICTRCGLEKLCSAKTPKYCRDCLDEKRQCLCGCGEVVTAGYNDSRYVLGHRVRMTTEETRAKKSQSQLGKYHGKEAKGSTISKGHRYLTGMQGHPLANQKGVVGEHRFVLYEAIGEGPHPCYHCGKMLDWVPGHGGIIADHLDTDRLNNDISNLVVSCNPCNVYRAHTPAEWSEVATKAAVQRELRIAQGG